MSGEALASAASDETIDAATVERMAKEMARAMDGGGLELAVVVGGGNIWRGTTGESGGMDRATSDTMGMLGTAATTGENDSYIQLAPPESSLASSVA